MEPQTAEKQSAPLSVDELIDKHTPKREAEPATSADQSTPEASPADPNVTPTPAPAPEKKYVSLDDALPEDFEHGFFRGKPLKELYKSFRATEAEMQRAQREAKEQAERAERYRAEAVAKDVAAQMAAEQRRIPEQQVDPLAEVEAHWFDDPPTAAAKLQEVTLARARQAFQAELQNLRQENSAEAQKAQLYKRAQTASEEARVELHLDEATWERRQKAVLADLVDPTGPYFHKQGPLVKENFLEAYQGIFGDASSASAPTPIVAAPAVANPPGSKKAAIGAAPSTTNAGLPTLSEERRKAYRSIAQQYGVDPDSFVKRMAGSLAGGGR